MSVTLVTGSSHGLGLEVVRQLCARGEKVIASCREASSQLQETSARIVEGIDLAKDESVAKLAEAIGETEVATIVCAAGIIEATGFPDFRFDVIDEIFQVNALGSLRVVSAAFSSLTSGSKIIFLTSRLGSITDNRSGGSYGYRMSKAALNIAAVSLAHDLRGRGIAVGLIHPGYVKTEMTGGRGDLTAEESVRLILQRMDELNIDTTGSFVHARGETLPW